MEALVIPALPGELAGGEGFSWVCRSLEPLGVTALTIPAGLIDGASEYELATVSRLRLDAQVKAEALAGIIRRSDALVVVNDGAESVLRPGGEQICTIQGSVGYFAKSVMTVAHNVYGEDSGRLFLSHEYPNNRDLTRVTVGTERNRRAVTMAGARLHGVSALNPIILRSELDIVAETIRAGHRRRNYS